MDASMCKQRSLAVAGQGRTNVSSFLNKAVQSSGSKPRGQGPSKGHKMNLRVRETVNGVEKKERRSSAAQFFGLFVYEPNENTLTQKGQL